MDSIYIIRILKQTMVHYEVMDQSVEATDPLLNHNNLPAPRKEHLVTLRIFCVAVLLQVK